MEAVEVMRLSSYQLEFKLLKYVVPPSGGIF